MHDPVGTVGEPPGAALRAEVREGLCGQPKTLPSKLFYDAHGSALFEEITRLPEYYLTGAETALLRARVPRWITVLRPHSLVELGAGSATKTHILLDAMSATAKAATYVPVDVSAGFLEETAERLRREYPRLEIVPLVADISAEFEPPQGLPGPTVYAFLGSTIGNFKPPAAIDLLRRLRGAMRPDDRLLLGADLRKEVDVLEAAYNDASGVTAEFNRNVLRVLNRELGADFDMNAFEHRAFYNRQAHRIEMQLVSKRRQRVVIPHLCTVWFDAGESIRTEVSYKYDRDAIEQLFHAADLSLEAWSTDTGQRFALAVGAP